MRSPADCSGTLGCSGGDPFAEPSWSGSSARNWFARMPAARSVSIRARNAVSAPHARSRNAARACGSMSLAAWKMASSTGSGLGDADSLFMSFMPSNDFGGPNPPNIFPFYHKSFLDAREQPGTCVAPLSLYGPLRDVEDGGNFRLFEPGEETKHDNLGALRSGDLKFRQRFIQLQQYLLFHWSRNFHLAHVDTLRVPAMAHTPAASCTVDKNLAHCLRCRAEEMLSVAPIRRVRPC